MKTVGRPDLATGYSLPTAALKYEEAMRHCVSNLFANNLGERKLCVLFLQLSGI